MLSRQTSKARREKRRATARDRSLARHVNRAFLRSRLDTVGLQFVVRDGTVTVYGAVGFPHERRDVLHVLKKVRHVGAVVDQIQIVMPQRPLMGTVQHPPADEPERG